MKTDWLSGLNPAEARDLCPSWHWTSDQFGLSLSSGPVWQEDFGAVFARVQEGP